MLHGNMGWRIYTMQSVDSTNTEAERLIRSLGINDTHQLAVVADRQTSGKGRCRERNWFSPSGFGLWCSLVLVPEIQSESLAQLTLVAAVAVAEAVEEETGVHLGIKWPNDLLYNGQKVCGILTEAVPLPQGDFECDTERMPVVVGIGVNLNQREGDFPSELQGSATSLAMIKELPEGQSVSRDSVFTGILKRFHTWYELWMTEGFAPVRQKWINLSCTMNRALCWEESGKYMEGTAVDLDPDGSLRVCMKDGAIHRLNAGEIRFLRPAQGKGVRDE